MPDNHTAGNAIAARPSNARSISSFRETDPIASLRTMALPRSVTEKPTCRLDKAAGPHGFLGFFGKSLCAGWLRFGPTVARRMIRYFSRRCSETRRPTRVGPTMGVTRLAVVDGWHRVT